MELNPNDPLIPYLISARQEKINAQKQAEANATNSAIEQQRDLAWQLFQETGIANDYIASVLGIPVGTTTMDYKKNQYDINKPYYKTPVGNTTTSLKDVIDMLNNVEDSKKQSLIDGLYNSGSIDDVTFDTLVSMF